MSYCVNCGVELAPSEEKCPLCKTSVINPTNPWKEPKEYPYPNRIETIVRHVDVQYFTLLATLLLMVPVFICLINDLFLHAGDITWSVYVVGGAGLLFVFFLLPLLLHKKRNPYVCLTLDVAALLIFLLLIDYKSDGPPWFLHLGMPLTLTLGFLAAFMTIWFKTRRPRPVLISIGLILYAAGIYTICTEMIINAYQQLSVLPHWSLYSFIPCALSGTIFILLNKHQALRENIYKRLFI